MDISELRELISLFENAEVSEFEYEAEGIRIRLKKEMNRPATGEVCVERTPLAANEPEPAAEESVAEELASRPVIKSPMVGIFYRCPAPDAPPFVEVGDFVEDGQTVCLIEAMKLMNEIHSSQSGAIVEVLVENGQCVEFGQPLFALEPAETE